MSWSDGREAGINQSQLKQRKKDALTAINGVLAMLASDEDLHEDLQLPIVKVAMQHWTGTKRLPPEQAAKLTENMRVISVLQKFQRLTAVCQAGGIAVPLDHLLARRPVLSDELAQNYFDITTENQARKNSSLEKPLPPSSSTTGTRVAGSTGKRGQTPSGIDIPQRTIKSDSSNDGAAGDKSTPFGATGEPKEINAALDASLAAAERAKAEEEAGSLDSSSNSTSKFKSQTRQRKGSRAMDTTEVDVDALKRKSAETKAFYRRMKETAVILVVVLVLCAYFRYYQ
jgi:hypothetical protein